MGAADMVTGPLQSLPKQHIGCLCLKVVGGDAFSALCGAGRSKYWRL